MNKEAAKRSGYYCITQSGKLVHTTRVLFFIGSWINWIPLVASYDLQGGRLYLHDLFLFFTFLYNCFRQNWKYTVGGKNFGKSNVAAAKGRTLAGKL